MLPSRYSPGSHISGTRQDPTFSGTHPDFTFPKLVRILHFRYLLGSHLFGTHQDPFRYSPGSYLFRYSPGFYLPCTRPDPTFPVLTRIPPFRYSPGSQISGTRPNPTFSALAWIPPFWYSPEFLPFRHSLGFYPFRYSPRFLLFRHLLGFYPFPVLTQTILWYSPGFHLFDTRRDSTFSCTHPDPTFSSTCPDPSPELTQTLLQSLPGFPHLLRHHPRISLSFLELCPDHSSSQALYLDFFKSFNQSESVPLTFSTR